MERFAHAMAKKDAELSAKDELIERLRAKLKAAWGSGLPAYNQDYRMTDTDEKALGIQDYGDKP